MKEMKYGFERENELLEKGKELGFTYYIINLGTHPTAYIEIPKGHKLYNKDCKDIYKEVDIDVHGGLTYSRNYLWIGKNQKIEGWFIGWDYAHYGDYLGCEERFPKELRTCGKKWTTEEILEEVKEACKKIYTRSNK